MNEIEATTVRIPPDITRKIRKMRQEKNLPSLWRAIEIYFDEKHSKELKALFDQQAELIPNLILSAAPLNLAIATATVFNEKYPELVKKESSLIFEKWTELLKIYPPSARKVIGKILELGIELDRMVQEVITKGKVKEKQRIRITDN